MADPDIDNLGERLRDSIGNLGNELSSGLDRLAALLIPAAQAARPVPKPTTNQPSSTAGKTDGKGTNNTQGTNAANRAAEMAEAEAKKRRESLQATIDAVIKELTVTGTNFSILNTLLSKVLPPGAEILISELGRTGAKFREVANAGAIFAGGLLDLRRSANTAGLTIEQYSKAIKENSEALAASGLGVTEAARRMSGALAAGGREFDLELRRLGYDFDEFGGLVAETMSIMRTAGAPLRATDEQIAQETRKYAENLRVISAITGEDAKKRMNEAKEAAKQLAFQQKIAGLSAEQQAAIMRAMGNMSPIMQKAFMEQVVFGGTVSKVTAATASMIPAFGDVVKEAGDLATAGQLDEVRFRDLMKERGATLEQEMRTLSGVPEAAMLGVGGIVGELGPALNGLYEYAKKFSPQAIEDAENSIKNLKASREALTESYVALSREMQKLKVTIENTLTSALEKTAGVLSGFVGLIGNLTTELVKIINEVVKRIPSTPAARASGGPVQGNTVYQVGELGPELFVPSSSGTIISNDAVRSMLARSNPQSETTIERIQTMVANAVTTAIAKPTPTQIDNETKQLLRDQIAIQKQYVTALGDMRQVLDDMRGQDQRYYNYNT